MDRWLKSLLAGGAALVLACLAILLCLGLAGRPLDAQVIGNRGPRIINRANNPFNNNETADEELVDGVFLPPDRTAKRRLELAKEMTEARRYGEAVRYLGSLLDSSEDYFFRPDAGDSVFRSLKAEAGRLVAALPAEGRESYELQFGAEARRMLEDASASGDLSVLAEVSRRYFYTKAGGEAALLLARNHLDHGRPLAAALLLERLHATSDRARFEPMLSLYLASSWLRSGMPERAQVTLVELKNGRPAPELRIAGKPAKWFTDDSQALAWLEDKGGQRVEGHAIDGGDDWLMYRGDPRRNGAARGGRPLLNPRWRVRVAHHPEIEKSIAQLRTGYSREDLAALPSLHPLAVGNVVLMRNSRSLVAVDFDSGKLIWEAELLGDDTFDQVLASASAVQQQFGQAPQKMQWLEQRIWDDPAYGTLSSDGQCVFFVEDLGLGVGGPTIILARGQRQQPLTLPRSYNRLAARELKTEGKLKWEVGGPTGEDEPKLAEAFFLGPPLALQGRLYVTAEMKGQEIRLLVLSAKTGKLEWSQQLCVVEQNIAQDPERRSGGGSPSFADGVLICPTSAGAVVAVDLTSRSLLWGYQYPRGAQAGMNRVNVLRMNGVFASADRRPGDRWADGMVTIVDGNVLITPVESDAIYCLNLIDGQLKWKFERENNLYVACADAGHLILVGHNQVTAYSLSEMDAKTSRPKAVWTLELPAGSMPSGRGFYSGHHYYLPLSSAEVAEIDLAAGTIVSRAKSRLGEVPGNLICHRGEIISQSPQSVETFYQLDWLTQDVTARLEKSPDDPQALARLGEIKLDQGQLPEAIELFRRSFQLAPEDRTRELLVDSLLDGLRTDFAGSRARAAELEKLIDRKQQRNTYLRLIAVGLKKSGEVLPAFQHYLRLLDDAGSDNKLEPQRAELEAIDESLSVRRERWLQAELADLRAHATPEEQRQLDEQIAQRLHAALQAKSPPELRKFLRVFGSHPLADRAREGLLVALAGNSLMERETLLRRLEQSPDEGTSRAAVARLAWLFDEARRPDLAVLYYKQLAGKLADAVCVDGKTGREIVAALPVDGATHKALEGVKPWQAGRVTVRDGGARTLSAAHHQRSFDLNLHGPAGPYFQHMNITLEPQQQTIVGEDGLGNERFKAMLHEPGNNRRVYGWNGVNGFNNPALNYVSVNGSLLMLWMGHQVLAIDTLRPGDTASRVLWSQDLNEPLPGLPVHQGFHQRSVPVPWGLPRFVAQDSYGRMIGSMGPVNFDGVCFQRFRDLVCADPLTGEAMWIRKNVAVGSDVFGDEEMLFVAPPDGGEALVLRALDGELLGRRAVAPLEQRMTTVGRNVLVWDTKDGRQAIILRDAWTGREVWSYSFDAGAKGAIVNDEAVGVLEPSGHFVLSRLTDGKRLAEDKLKSETSLSGIYLLGSSTQYLLVTNSPPSNEQPNVNVQPAPGGLNDPIINGWVYAFARTDSNDAAPADAAGAEPAKQQWLEPFEVKQQGLVLTQPSEVPLLFFLSHRHTANAAGSHETRTSVLALDKRNGMKAYGSDDLRVVISNFEITADQGADTVSLMLPNKTFTFHLTSDALPTKEEQAKAEKKGILGAIGGAILRAVEKQRRAGDPDDDD